jgi:L-fuconolactonase
MLSSLSGAWAQLPNTRIKIGGLGMTIGGSRFHEWAEPPSSAELVDAWRPYAETAIALFLVCKGMFNYRAFWNACKRLAAGCSTGALGAIQRHRHRGVSPAGGGDPGWCVMGRRC